MNEDFEKSTGEIKKIEEPDMILMDSCPVCGSDWLENYIETNLTNFFFPVSEEIIHKVKKERFTLNICMQCSHVFQTNIEKDLLNLIYKEFYNHYNLDTSIEFQLIYRERTINFLKNVISAGENQKALDIGCGEGTYFSEFRKMGFDCYGIEPSPKSEIAKKKNPDAIISNEFFNNCDTNIFGTSFDVIMMNWVLEHIENIEDFFDKLKAYIKKGTTLFIQVPDLDYYIEHNMPLFYVHEHINYFSAQTLCLLLKRKGFKIIDVVQGDSPALLVAGEYMGIEQKIIVQNKDQIIRKKDFIVNNEALKAKVKKIISKNEKIIFYGIGLLSFWISDFCLSDKDKEKIVLLDDNSYYKGKMVPSFNKQLQFFPDGYDLEGYTVFITTSPVYHDKIKENIQNKFTGHFQIATIKNNDVIIESC
ncbi:MAG: methyltransferase domain-containing protein [Desulfobacula sp.]|jgi:2-polyprenyl-3-methyl-5-hydroxy-6-metoxy-1,4-benzoquinol methylase|nr:methyltransferase domain-containing protein [Desulfobacula sp.]